MSPYDDILLPFLKEEIISPMNIKPIDVKKDDKVEYLKILKIIVESKNKLNVKKEVALA